MIPDISETANIQGVHYFRFLSVMCINKNWACLTTPSHSLLDLPSLEVEEEVVLMASPCARG